MYDHYDVAIIGAGIAGCGLAYNLKRIGYKGSVLVIDKDKPGKNASSVYRNTFKKVIDKYKLPYEHKFDGAIVGTYTKSNKLKENFYFVDYSKICRHLLQNSNAVFKKEKALDIKNQTLYTNKNKYKFTYLTDCSGANFFLRKLYNLPLPFRYWIGNVKILKNKMDLENYFYYLSNQEGYMEDLYSIKNKTFQGDWQYAPCINFDLIKPPNNTLCKKLVKKPYIIKQERAVIPSTPVFPIAFKNFAFLGDSFGNASTSVSEGIRPILDSSKILAKAIKENDLKLYEKEWSKNYLNLYIKKLALKLSSKLKVKLLNLITNNPELLKKLMKNQDVKIPNKIKKKIPLYLKTEVIKNYVGLRIRYSIMKFKFRNSKQPYKFGGEQI